MGRITQGLVAFNRGLVSRLALARTDLTRVGLSAETMTNWMPRVLGAMSLRPGMGYLATAPGACIYMPFVFSTLDTALIEASANRLRIFVDDAVVTRPTVTATVTNGSFDTDLTGWTDADEAGASSVWSAGYLSLTGTGFKSAVRQQSVAVAEGGTEHALDIVVTRGPVVLRVGSTLGGDEYIAQTTLATGRHSLAFTPTDTFHIDLSNDRATAALVDSVQVDSGVLELVTPWGEDDLLALRWDQSGDVLFVAADGYQQKRIERRGTHSWSLVDYAPEDGPFRVLNVSATRLAPSALSGDVTITANNSLFRSGHVGALFRITSIGQNVAADLTGDGQFTGEIRVTGVGTERAFTIVRAGTWTGTLRLQRSISEPGAWTNVTTYTSNGTTSFSDGLDNQIIYYRLGFSTGDYGSGTAEASMSYSNGGLTGIARITAVASSTSASAAVLTPFGATDESSDWSEGEWSDYRGWPTAVAFYEGRLCWAGRDRFWASISDEFASFDDTREGDSGPISRSIGSGPVDSVNWLLGLQRLCLGTDGSEWTAHSSALDEPLSPTNFQLKEASTQGSAAVAAVKIDSRGIFVQRSGIRAFQLTSAGQDSIRIDYAAEDMTAIVPEIGSPGIRRMAVQRQPDTRVHFVRDDGAVAVLIFDAVENVMCWLEVETDGTVEDVVVLPGMIEDQVYYLVRRTIGSTTARYLEKWAREDECRGGQLCKLGDSFITYEGDPISVVTGLDHLEGRSVVAWGDGTDRGTYTVSGGQITLSSDASSIMVGLYYRARWKSTKLAYGAVAGTALTKNKRVHGLGIILADTHAQGLRYGPDFSTLDDMPMIEGFAAVDQDSIWTDYDDDMISFPGEWGTDSRVCLEAAAPRPATVLAIAVTMETNE